MVGQVSMKVCWASVSLVTATAICFGLTLGLQRTSGIYFILFQEEFNATASEVSMIFGLSISFMYLGGLFKVNNI